MEYSATELLKMCDDLKYLNRLNATEFFTLFYPDSDSLSYLEPKWELFRDNKLGWFWGASPDKIAIAHNYIKGCKDRSPLR
jgi:hypothetical protein